MWQKYQQHTLKGTTLIAFVFNENTDIASYYTIPNFQRNALLRSIKIVFSYLLLILLFSTPYNTNNLTYDNYLSIIQTR